MTQPDSIRKRSTLPYLISRPTRRATQPRARSGVLARICSLRLVGAALVAVWVYFLVPRSMEDPDIWWHLRDAALAWQTHRWLHRDLYSFTAAAAPWINHEWLAELPFYLAWRVAGPKGLYLITLLIIECILLGLYWLTCQKSKRSTVTSSVLATAIATLLATVSFGPRTLLLGWACLIIELLMLEKFAVKAVASSTRYILALPLLFCLWINLHGSWLIGLVLFVVFIVSGIRPFASPFRKGSLVNPGWSRVQLRTLSVALLLSLGALFVNPYGWHLVVYPLDLAFQQPLNIASVEEWRPLDFQSARGLIFFLVLAALAPAQLLRRHHWALWELAFAAIGIYAAFRHARFLFLGAILVTPLLGRMLAHAFPRKPPRPQHLAHFAGPRPCIISKPAANDRPLLNALLIASIFGVAAVATFERPRNLVAPASAFPAAALPALRTLHPQDRIFNEYLWGGYLAYQLPRLPVFIDSRMDIYERNGTLRDYLDIIHLKNSLVLLDRYRIRYVLFEKDAPLVYLLQHTHAWTSDYDDGRVVLLERSSSSTNSSFAAIAATQTPVR